MKKGYKKQCESDLECHWNLGCLNSKGSLKRICLCENNTIWNGDTCGKCYDRKKSFKTDQNSLFKTSW